MLAAKRDEVLLQAAKEDIALKKSYMSKMQKSQASRNEMAKAMSASLQSLVKSVSDSLGLLAIALNPNIMQMANQNNFGHMAHGNPTNNMEPKEFTSQIIKMKGSHIIKVIFRLNTCR